MTPRFTIALALAFAPLISCGDRPLPVPIPDDAPGVVSTDAESTEETVPAGTTAADRDVPDDERQRPTSPNTATRPTVSSTTSTTSPPATRPATTPPRTTVPDRVKALRRRILDQFEQLPESDPARQACEQSLEDVFLVVQLYSYPGDYVSENPSIERIAETLDKLEEDLLKIPTATIRGAARSSSGRRANAPSEAVKGWRARQPWRAPVKRSLATPA